MHIVLAEIDPLLFPDYYPFYKDYFKDEKMYLASKEEKSDIGMANIKFMIKLVRKSQSIQDMDTRGFVRYLYEKWVDKTYDWQRSYSWYELKSLLLFFVLFSDVESLADIEKRVNSTNAMQLMGKYS